MSSKRDMYSALSARFALGLPTAPASFSIAATDPNTLLSTLAPGSFDAIMLGGASNASCFGDAATEAFNANVILLGNDNIIKLASTQQAYDVETNQTDLISADVGAIGPGGLGSSLCNAINEYTGRLIVLIPCMTGSSYVVPGTTLPPQHFTWEPSYQVGGRTVGVNGNRNTIFNSAVARTKDIIARGARFLGVAWYGDGEALLAQTFGDQWPTVWNATIDAFYAAIGVSHGRAVFAQMAATSHGTNWTNFLTNTQPLAIVAGKRLMSTTPDGPYKPDGQGHLTGSADDVVGRGRMFPLMRDNGWLDAAPIHAIGNSIGLQLKSQSAASPVIPTTDHTLEAAWLGFDALGILGESTAAEFDLFQNG